MKAQIHQTIEGQSFDLSSRKEKKNKEERSDHTDREATSLMFLRAEKEKSEQMKRQLT